MTAWTRLALVTLIGLAVGCGGKPDAEKPAPAAKASPATDAATTQAPAAPTAAPAPTPAAAPDASAAAASPSGDAAAKPEEPSMVSPIIHGPSDGKLPMVSRETLEKAYMEIYCAQRKGEPEKLIAIFDRYGFKNPRTWTASWTEAVKDQAWVARLTQEALNRCP